MERRFASRSLYDFPENLKTCRKLKKSLWSRLIYSQHAFQKNVRWRYALLLSVGNLTSFVRSQMSNFISAGMYIRFTSREI